MNPWSISFNRENLNSAGCQEGEHDSRRILDNCNEASNAGLLKLMTTELTRKVTPSITCNDTREP